MPARSVKARAPQQAVLSNLIAAKHHWKVSLASLVVRMHGLGLLSDWQYRSLFVAMSSRGYLKQEPNGGPRETSQVLAKALGLLRDRGLSTSDIAHDLHVGVETLNKLIFGLTLTPLDGGGDAFQSPAAQRPQLRVI